MEWIWAEVNTLFLKFAFVWTLKLYYRPIAFSANILGKVLKTYCILLELLHMHNSLILVQKSMYAVYVWFSQKNKLRLNPVQITKKVKTYHDTEMHRGSPFNIICLNVVIRCSVVLSSIVLPRYPMYGMSGSDLFVKVRCPFPSPPCPRLPSPSFLLPPGPTT